LFYRSAPVHEQHTNQNSAARLKRFIPLLLQLISIRKPGKPKTTPARKTLGCP
jgi:hypothetical protein